MQLVINYKSADAASQSNAKEEKGEEGILVHYVTSCISESQHFF